MAAYQIMDRSDRRALADEVRDAGLDPSGGNLGS